MYPVAYHHHAQARTPSAGLAVASLVLGIVGVVLSFMPIVNNLTAAGAVVGFVLGFVGIWRSRAVMSGFGVFLCGAAVVLTVVAQTKLRDKLDQLGAEIDALGTPETAQAATAPTGYAPAPVDFTLQVVTLEEQCFGSAGCLVTFQVTATYVGPQQPDPTRTFTAVYDVQGGNEPLTHRFTIDAGAITPPTEQMIQTNAPRTPLTATVTTTL